MSQKDFIGGDDVEYLQQQMFGKKTSTDSIISVYENKISQNIASKILAATRRGKTPDFTQEELLYLNKQADEIDDTELKVITPTPAITIKKGKTELNIGHAATLVQKMEEKYPTTPKKPVFDDTATASFEVAAQEEQASYDTAVSKFKTLGGIALPAPPQTEIKSVNKNAYEIREAILAHALDWVKFSYEAKPQPSKPSEDEVLSVAQKFYKFVENKR